MAEGRAALRQTAGADPAAVAALLRTAAMARLSRRQRQLVRQVSAATLDRLLAPGAGANIRVGGGAAPNRAVCCGRKFRFARALGI